METEIEPRTFLIEVPLETQRKIFNFVPHLSIDSQTDEDIFGILLKNLSDAIPYEMETPFDSEVADKTVDYEMDTNRSKTLSSKSLLTNSAVLDKLSRQCSEESFAFSPQSAGVQKVQNILDLCLLCAQVPKDGQLINIFGDIGRSLKLIEKIHRYLTITIEEGFPVNVCVSCIGKLNVCHELVQNCEVSYRKLQKLRNLWESQQKNQRIEIYTDEDSTDLSTTPCPVAVIDFQSKEEMEVDSLATDLNITDEPNVAYDTENVTFETHQTSLLVKSSQTVYLLTDNDATEFHSPKINLIVINVDVETDDYEQKIEEKLRRIKETNFKWCTIKNEDMTWDIENTDILWTTLPFACQMCKYSFFNEEQLLSHFKSLHPTQVTKCCQCNISICGTKEERNLHIDNCVSDQHADNLLKTLISNTVPIINQFDPEYIIIPVGSLETNGCLPVSKILCEVERNKFIKVDIKKEIRNALATFKFTNLISTLCHLCGENVCTKNYKFHLECVHALGEMNHCDMTKYI